MDASLNNMFLTALEDRVISEQLDNQQLMAIESFFWLVDITERISQGIEDAIVEDVINRSETESELKRDTDKTLDIDTVSYNEEVQIPCVICTDTIKKDEEICKLECGHIYHGNCIKEWGYYKQECPQCRKTIPLAKDNLVSDK